MLNAGDRINAAYTPQVIAQLHAAYAVAAPGFKKFGCKKGATIDYGGANIARADFFELLGSDFFWTNMCAERT